MRSLVRRSFLGVLLSTPLFPSGSGAGTEEDSLPDPIAAGRWMDEALTMRASESPLKMQRFSDPIYILLDPITWKPNSDQVGFPEIIVPRGFVTDLASIPRIFWSILRPDADYAYAAIIHDFLYWQQTLPKHKADTILKMSMEDFQLSRPIVASIYYAVVILGKTAWSTNRNAKANGESRILQKFPLDAKITWEQWKRRNDVFLK